MDNYLKEKADLLLKSLYKNVKRLKQKKNAIEDVLDSNRTAEINPDDIPAGSSGILNKAKKEEVKKNEEIAQKLLKNLETISKAYKLKMEKRCWEGYEPTPGKEAYSEGSCQPIKKEEKEKPFHGYNKEKHSAEGGLSAKAREKYNRETGSNLKAPVSSKEAKKSPKKAARRKSFCARMSGAKGATSKKGKLTPKGAALKRWDC